MAELFDVLAKRNLRIAASERRKESEEETESPTSAILQDGGSSELELWARAPACKEKFIPYLSGIIEQLEREENRQVVNHALLAYARGQVKALKNLREAFENWSR